MTEDKRLRRNKVLVESVEDLHLENGVNKRAGGGRRSESTTGSNGVLTPNDAAMKSETQSPVKNEKVSESPKIGSEEHEEVIGGGVTVKEEAGQPPKLSRTTSQKIIARPPLLFNDCPSKTEEARGTFDAISECTYTSKYIGSTEHGSMECDCQEDWDSHEKTNLACGEDSDCINRATKMECVDDCGCGPNCQNQRFQRQECAKVTVFKTAKKGYGLRADTDLAPNDFIYEYIGEVIDEARFRRRMLQYDEEGITHFYFMSLTKGEFVDATKKGNLGRFCNHSCNPNCYVDKWVVGEKLRMGIFAERKIKAGEELVFNYNVDRYGANPQPCYCGEPNCTGFIGGKTQTERATKLPQVTIEALGIDDGDGWDTAVAKKPRKKRAGEEDEEYVNNVQPKSLDEHGVTKVMATLMQCKEKWITVKLLDRIQRCDDERVRNRVVKMHGYQILNSTLGLWKEDANVVLQIFDILDKFPRLTRNKISDSKIETTVGGLTSSEDARVASQAENLLKEWSTLEVAYRIPRKKREVPNAANTSTPEKATRFGRRDSSREGRKARSKSRSKSRSRSRSPIDAPRGPAAPSGPRSNFPQRGPGFYSGPRPAFRPRPFALPQGWFAALDENGRTYYYDSSGKTTWERPTNPALPPPPPPKPTSTNKALEDIINSITNEKNNTPKEKTVLSIPKAASGQPMKDPRAGSEKWRTYSEEKQKKLYENTLFPHIKHVVDKFKGKLARDDLKRFAKEISKKLVNSDYKNHRVEDPTKISSRQEKQVKKYVHDYFEKAVVKKKEHDRKKSERKAREVELGGPLTSTTATKVKKEEEEEEKSDGEQDVAMSDDEDMKLKRESATPVTPLDPQSNAEGLKRKREEDEPDDMRRDDATPSKRLRSETPPPPPPPPPANRTPLDPLTPSNDNIENGVSQMGTPAQYQTLPDDGDYLVIHSPIDGYEDPPPPPPPYKARKATDDEVNSLGQTQALDTPDMTTPEHERNVLEHEQHFSEHRRNQVTDVQIPGEA